MELEEKTVNPVMFEIKPESRMSDESKLLYNIFMVLVDINAKLDRVITPTEEQAEEELFEDKDEKPEEEFEQVEEQDILSKKQYVDSQELYSFENITPPVSM
jgi:hypothetical protein